MLKQFSIRLSFVVISACRGGGSSTNALEGVFVDSRVEGIRSQTPTHEGTIDSIGTFTYEPGEQIQFYIGDILLHDSSIIISPI